MILYPTHMNAAECKGFHTKKEKNCSSPKTAPLICTPLTEYLLS